MDAAGGGRSLLGLEGLPRDLLERLLDRASAWQRALASGRVEQPLRGRFVANMFFEDSTRTRSSFEMAAKLLGAEVLNWTARGSSTSKGETFLDTVRNVAALGASALVIRHTESGCALLASRAVDAAVVNAGDGSHEHPSQGLLDAFTLLERWRRLDGKTVVICGDILHSRVARSNLFALRTLGARVVVCAPPTLMPAGFESLCDTSHSLDEVLGEADAVMLLRVQLERMAEAFFPSAGEFSRRFGLTAARAARMKQGALVMHPGPINRGVELAPEVADGERSVVLRQVANGIPVRMAILERACA
ncbi:MAG: Aspartate carbamoyltransferase [Pseudomonadota bacterium]